MKKFLSILFALFVGASVLAQTPNVATTIENVTSTEVTASFVKNEVCNSYRVYITTDEEMVYWTGMMQCSETVIVENWGAQYTNNATHTFDDLTPGTEYKIYVLASGTGEAALLQTTVTTAATGGSGASVITIAVTNITSTSALVTCTPNAETALFHDFIITDSLFAEMGADSVIAMLKEDPYHHYEEYDWEWLSLQPNTAYYSVAIGQNANGVWGDLAIFPFSTTPTAVADFENGDFMIYPNPASTSVKLENIPSQGNVQICDLQGKVVLEQTLNDANMTINLKNVSRGIYVVKIFDEGNLHFMTKKLVVR